MMDFKNEEKFQNFPPCRLQDISVWSDKNPIFAPAKIQAAVLQKITFVWKNVQNGGYSLISLFKSSCLHAWKFSNHLELYNK